LPNAQFKLETLQANGPDVISKGCGQFTVDIRKAYYAVEMDEEAWPYLCWKHGEKVYSARVLIFGLNLAPMIFHKIMREVVRFFRALGIKVLNYIDDFLFNETVEKIRPLIEFVRWLLPRLGWTTNEKCEWDPKFAVVFLGLIADTEKYEYRVPDEKIRRVAAVIRMLKTKADRAEPIEVEDLRVVTGRLMSMRLAVSPVRVWTRALYHEITEARGNKRVRSPPQWTANSKPIAPNSGQR